MPTPLAYVGVFSGVRRNRTGNSSATGSPALAPVSLSGDALRLRLKQREVDYVEPLEDAVNDRPQDGVVGRV
jgi:hypothetical protein